MQNMIFHYGEIQISFSYEKLLKKLIVEKMNKTDLYKEINLSPRAITQYVEQMSSSECGIICVAMILRYYIIQNI